MAAFLLCVQDSGLCRVHPSVTDPISRGLRARCAREAEREMRIRLKTEADADRI